MNRNIKDCIRYLELSYSGAKMWNDTESMIRISRALVAIQANINEDIFKEEFVEKTVKEDFKR